MASESKIRAPVVSPSVFCTQRSHCNQEWQASPSAGGLLRGVHLVHQHLLTKSQLSRQGLYACMWWDFTLSNFPALSPTHHSPQERELLLGDFQKRKSAQPLQGPFFPKSWHKGRGRDQLSDPVRRAWDCLASQQWDGGLGRGGGSRCGTWKREGAMG